MVAGFLRRRTATARVPNPLNVAPSAKPLDSVNAVIWAAIPRRGG